MKSRFLFAPIPILITGALLGMDFWTGSHWGIYLLTTLIAGGCTYEMGVAYNSTSLDVPVLFLTVCVVVLMLLSGFFLLFPSCLPELVSEFKTESSIPSHVAINLPFQVLILVTMLYCTDARSPKPTRGTLTGLGLLTLFFVTYLHGYFILNQFSSRPGFATTFVVYLLVVSKGADSGSYLIGKAFGTRKMTPRLSPNKTWMGLAGGLLTGVLLGALFFLTRLGDLASLPVLLVISFVISLAAALGDLVGSILKRGAQVKDSSNVFPELGGILDMTDSFLVSVPVALVILLLIS